MDTLSKLFGSTARVKVLKLFIFNPDEVFEPKEVAKKAKISQGALRKEISLLQSIDFIKRKSAYKEVPRKVRGRTEVIKKRITGYSLNYDFYYLAPLSNLLGSADEENHKMVLRRLRPTGNLKLVIISGFLLQDPDSRIDLLVVADKLRKGLLENAIKSIESEIGRELRYAAFETPEFQYRLGVYDRLVRDVIDFPHKKLLNKIQV